jgi:hypothetical protein
MLIAVVNGFMAGMALAVLITAEYYSVDVIGLKNALLACFFAFILNVACSVLGVYFV